jgi:choline dehydrogenase-like flavoprotein
VSRSTLVVGAGVSGLSVALAMLQARSPVTVLERGEWAANHRGRAAASSRRCCRGNTTRRFRRWPCVRWRAMRTGWRRSRPLSGRRRGILALRDAGAGRGRSGAGAGLVRGARAGREALGSADPCFADSPRGVADQQLRSVCFPRSRRCATRAWWRRCARRWSDSAARSANSARPPGCRPRAGG